MKNYRITLSNGRTSNFDSTCAADAIQAALMKNIGLTVTACELRDLSGNGMSFDVPKHVALTVDDVARLKPKREPKERCEPVPQRPAPWIEEWAAQKGVRL